MPSPHSKHASRGVSSQRGGASLLVLVAVIALLAAAAFLLFSDSPPTPRPQFPDAQLETPAPERPVPTVAEFQAEDLPVKERNDIEVATESGQIAGGLILGRVVDDLGNPVPDAMVVLSERFGLGQSFLGNMPQESDKKHPGSQKRTDANGVYRFHRMPSGKIFEMWVRHDDFAPTAGPTVVVQKDQKQELPPVVLKSGFVLRGYVTDIGGNPLQALVQITMQQASLSSPGSNIAKNLELGRTLEVVAGADGHFEIPRVAQGIWRLRATYEGYGSAEINPLVMMNGKVPDEQHIELGPEYTISGRVVDGQGVPVVNAQVNTARSRPRPPMSFSATTDEQGAFTLKGLPNGMFGIYVEAEGFSSSRRPNVESNSKDIEIVMQVRGGVSGRVVQQSGAPVSDFSLTVLTTHRGTPQYGVTGKRYAFSDPNGNFEIADLDPGSYVLMADNKSYAPSYSPGFRVDRDIVQGIDISVRKGARVFGQVVDLSTGKAVSNASVSVHGVDFQKNNLNNLFGGGLGDPNNVPKTETTTGRDGRFDLLNVYPGDVVLQVKTRDHIARYIPVNLQPESRADMGTIKLNLGGVLSGSVTDSTGRPSVGCTVYLTKQSAAGFFNEQLTVNARGEFRYSGLATGDYDIVAISPSTSGLLAFPNESDGSRKRIYLTEGSDNKVVLRIPSSE